VSAAADTSPARVCSVNGNWFGQQGAKFFAEALKANSTLTSVKYAAAPPHTFLIWQSVSSR